MAFQGSLAELHLPDIIQLVSVSGKTGIFHLTEGTQRGEIYLKDGRIVHAGLGEIEGEEAVYELAIWRKGEFRFDADVEAPRETIQKRQHQPPDGGRPAARRVAGPGQEDPLGGSHPRVRHPREPRGADQSQHDGMAGAFQDRRPAQPPGHRRSRGADGLRRGQAPLRPGSDRPHPPEGPRSQHASDHRGTVSRLPRPQAGRCTAPAHPARPRPRRMRGAARPRRGERGAEALPARPSRDRGRGRGGGSGKRGAADRPGRRRPEGQRGGGQPSCSSAGTCASTLA